MRPPEPNDFETVIHHRLTHLDWALQFAPYGHVMEFGVGNGDSLRVLARRMEPLIVWGFDTFHGLPEPWDRGANSITPKGAHDRGGRVPEAIDNAEYMVGLFSETIPRWKKAHDGWIGFMHIDCDLYAGAHDALFLLNDRIGPDTIIVFDELRDWEGGVYENWREHEWKALCEWCAEFDREVQWMGRDERQAASCRVVK